VSLDLALLDALPAAVVGASTFLKIVKALVMVLFVLSAILLIAVVLLQEGKGGGIAGAFGGAAAETFGVKAGTVNRFTSILATVFVGLALIHAGIASNLGTSAVRADPPPPLDTPFTSPGPGTSPGSGTPPGTPPPAAMDEPAMTDPPPAPPAEPAPMAPDAPPMGDAPPPPAMEPEQPPK
jgi:preprotein translocase subunit SecG